MALVKRVYTNGETVITAENLNAIQDEIISNAGDISLLSSNLASLVDSTLSTAGKAADAKATGDAITVIDEAFLSLKYGNRTTKIDASQSNPLDLDDYKAPGNYYTNGAAATNNLAHSPITGCSIRVFVMTTSGTSYVVQIVVASNKSKPGPYIRYGTSTGWGDWRNMTPDIDTNPTSGSDNPVSSGGVYAALSALQSAEGTAWD